MVQVFSKAESYYLAIGMTHDQFWDDDPWLIWVYRDAHQKRIEMRSQEMWLQGLYNYHALTTALANFGNALGGKKRKRKQDEYLKEPIRLSPMTEREKAMKQIEEREKQIAEWRKMERQAEFEEKQKAREERRKAKQKENEVTERADD